MGIVTVDTYKGENPENFNNPPLNEVLVTQPRDDMGNFIGLYASVPPNNPFAASVRVALLQPTSISFTVIAVVTDGDVCRVKLAVPVANVNNVPSGLNLGYVDISGPSVWGRALCSINLDAKTLPVDFGPGPLVTGLSPSHGPAAGGNQVVIYGINLSNAVEVDFGGPPNYAQIQGWGPTALIVSAPGGTAGETVDVTVVTPIGTSPINPADQYTYDALGAGPGPAGGGPVFPQVAGLNPSHGPEIGTNKVQIFGQGLSNATKVSFGGTAATISPSPSDNDGQMTVIAPGGMGTVDVRVTTPQGTSAINSPADLYTYDSASSGPSANSSPGIDCATLLRNWRNALAAWNYAVAHNMSPADIQLFYETLQAATTAAEPCIRPTLSAKR